VERHTHTALGSNAPVESSFQFSKAGTTTGRVESEKNAHRELKKRPKKRPGKRRKKVVKKPGLGAGAGRQPFFLYLYFYRFLHVKI